MEWRTRAKEFLVGNRGVICVILVVILLPFLLALWFEPIYRGIQTIMSVDPSLLSYVIAFVVAFGKVVFEYFKGLRNEILFRRS